VASFYADDDGDGAYDDLMDSYTLAWPISDGESTQPHGLIARYTFDDGAATDSAPEHLGRGINGTLENGAQISSDGAKGQALWVPGSDEYVEAGAIDDYVLSINGDLTISLWANFNELSTTDWGNTLLCYGTSDYYSEDEETNYSYWLSVEDVDGAFYLFMIWEQGDGSIIYAYRDIPVDLELDRWHHLAATRDEDTMEVRFFINGDQWGGAIPVDGMPTSGGRGMLYLGLDNPEYIGYDYDLHGGLDEVCVYDIVLSADEVAGLSQLEDCANYGDQQSEDTTETGTTTGGDDGGTTDTTTGGASGETDTTVPGGTGSGSDGDGEDTAAAESPMAVKDGGCACSTGAPVSSSGSGFLLFVAGLIGLIRRRSPGSEPSAPQRAMAKGGEAIRRHLGSRRYSS